MLKALRHPPLARLWFGQALSSIGDEIYRVGLTWMAVGLIGKDTGYLTAGQFGALMILSLIGGKWADNWNSLSTMMAVDFSRAAVIMIPVFWSFYAPIPLSLLVIVALVIAALSAFFDPALQSALPEFSPNRELLQAANGLMSTTIRMARMIGPGLVGVLSGWVPPIHFFSLNALSFVFSAAFVRSLRQYEVPSIEEAAKKTRTTLKEAIFSAYVAVKDKPPLPFILFSKGWTGGFWNLSFILGYALMAQEVAPGDVSSFGMLVGAYGSGNIASALYFGNRERKAPLRIMYLGHVIVGFGFAATALSLHLKWMAVLAALTAVGGPMTELGFLDVVQTKLPVRDITKIFRLRMALETAVTLALMLLAPFLFKTLGTRPIVICAGLGTAMTGFYGFMFKNPQAPN